MSSIAARAGRHPLDAAAHAAGSSSGSGDGSSRGAALTQAVGDPSVVVVKVVVPDGTLTDPLAASLGRAAQRGVEVTVVVGTEMARHARVAAMREAGVVVVATEQPSGPDVGFVVIHGDGTRIIGVPGRRPSTLTDDLVLDAFNRWTLRGRAV